MSHERYNRLKHLWARKYGTFDLFETYIELMELAELQIMLGIRRDDR